MLRKSNIYYEFNFDINYFKKIVNKCWVAGELYNMHNGHIELRNPVNVFTWLIKNSDNLNDFLSNCLIFEHIALEYQQLFTKQKEIADCELIQKYATVPIFLPSFTIPYKNDINSESNNSCDFKVLNSNLLEPPSTKTNGTTGKQLLEYTIPTTSDTTVNKLINLVNKVGIYFLYDVNGELMYIGKSINLGDRILSSARERKASYFSYGLTNSKADLGIYEIYYINRYQPCLNQADKHSDSLTLELPELSFSDKFNLLNLFRVNPV